MTTTPDEDTASTLPDGPDRRIVLRSAGLAGGLVGAATVLAGCGSSSSSGATKSAAGGSAAGNTSSDAAGGSSSGAAGSGGSAKGVATSKVPVGSGIIDTDLQAVITQPTSGQFKAFSYICTHRGCPITQISGSTITCPCHGSQFSIKDGSVLQGPATKPLPAKTATVQGSQVIVS